MRVSSAALSLSILCSIGCQEVRERPSLLDCEAKWQPECELDFGGEKIHPTGISDETDPAFHGALLYRSGWDFMLCAGCHGPQYDGGGSGVSCLECHDRGPTDCTTCHPTQPESGSHTIHLSGGPLEKPSPCASCHLVPSQWDAFGHILESFDVVDPPPVELVQGAAFSYDTRTCTNACHLLPSPPWETQVNLGCDGCHGFPPSTHGSDDACNVCHRGVTDDADAIADRERHLNGTVDLGPNGDGCDGCHGAAGDPSPPLDLAGRSSVTEVTVGAHRIHLNPRLGLRGPIPCADCHLVPDALGSPGHIDTSLPAEVFVEGAPSLARARGANPIWDRTAATCSNVYCHGDSVLPWTDPNERLVCGSCHGVPPATAIHAGADTLTTCHNCHPRVMNETGSLIRATQPKESEHIDGEVDL